jgi:hypothetical protein
MDAYYAPSKVEEQVSELWGVAFKLSCEDPLALSLPSKAGSKGATFSAISAYMLDDPSIWWWLLWQRRRRVDDMDISYTIYELCHVYGGNIARPV